MTGFHNIRFPDNIAYGATGSPEFVTTVVVTGAGYEQRSVNWAEARGCWDVGSGLKSQQQLDAPIAELSANFVYGGHAAAIGPGHVHFA
jgi:uncharacterized protein (TIGR02217 family)